MDDLPKEFDVIIVGTGLSESILSAAVSRNGHTVLHLDPTEYYGGKWATLNWEQLDSDLLAKGSSAANQNQDQNQPPPSSPTLESIEQNNEPPSTLPTQFERSNCIRNVERQWYTSDTTKQAEISKSSRKFNIDIYPKVVLAREEIIQLLIDSNVSRYLEFKCISKLLVGLQSSSETSETIIEPVPLSRSDIFTSKSLGLIEKRKLTKFIDLILNPTTKSEEGEEGKTETEVSLETIIKTSGIGPKIQNLIQTAVQTVEDSYDQDESVLNSNFVAKFRLFLQSIGRYGNQTPYLWTLYGIGEICQAFCRLSAIYGGIFILKRSVQSVQVQVDDGEDKTEDKRLVVGTDGAQIKAKYLVLGSEVTYGPNGKEESPVPVRTERVGQRTVARGVLLTLGGKIKKDASQILTSEEPAKSTESHMSVYKIGDMEIIEVDSTSLAVPEPYRLIHVAFPYMSEENSPRTIIESRLGSFLQFSTTSEEEKEEKEIQEDAIMKPSVLFGSYFTMDFVEYKCTLNDAVVEDQASGETLLSRILYCSSKTTGITGEIDKAKEIFAQMFPGEEFLPKAPDAPEPEPEDPENFA